VYPHKDPLQWVKRLAGERIHRAADIEVRVIDGVLIATLARLFERRMAFGLAISGGELFVSLATETLTGQVSALSLA